MSWKRWKLGAVVSLVLSLFVAGAALTTGATWMTFVAVFCAAAATHFGAFLQQNPVDKVDFETTTTNVRTTTDKTTVTTAVAPPSEQETK